MTARRRLDGVSGNLDIAIRAVLEADRGGQPGSQLAMHLAFRGTCTDGAPADEVADVLRRDRVEELAARWHAQLVDPHEQVARDAQALVDPEAAVEIRIVDEPLPAHRGPRLLEIHPHHDLQGVSV